MEDTTSNARKAYLDLKKIDTVRRLNLVKSLSFEETGAGHLAIVSVSVKCPLDCNFLFFFLRFSLIDLIQ